MLRLATPEDGAALAAVYAPYVVDAAQSFEEAPPTAAEMARRVAATVPQRPWLVAEDGGVVAYAYAGPHRSRPAYRWCVEVSVYVHPDHHRKGHGRRLYGALFELLRRQGYRRAYAGITLPNAGSVGLHEALGFAAVGVYEGVGYKAGRWHDVGWWTLPLLPPVAHPPEPRPLSADDAARLG